MRPNGLQPRGSGSRSSTVVGVARPAAAPPRPRAGPSSSALPEPQRGIVVGARDRGLDRVPIRPPGRNGGNDDRHLHGRPGARRPAARRSSRWRRPPSAPIAHPTAMAALSYGHAMLRARVAVGLALAASRRQALSCSREDEQRPGTPAADDLHRPGRGVHVRLLARPALIRGRDGNRARREARRSRRTPAAPRARPGLIGRDVTVHVERVLWRRPHAPEPPRRFRFSDIGWTGTLRNNAPSEARAAETRMVLGRRYLAPIVRSHGEWYPFFTTRLRLRGDLVVGGVDVGEPEPCASRAGRPARGGGGPAVARRFPTAPPCSTRAGAPDAAGSARIADHYRLWGDPEGPAGGRGRAASRAVALAALPAPARRAAACAWACRRGRSGTRFPSRAARAAAPRTLRAARGPARPLLARRGAGLFVFGHTGSRVYAACACASTVRTGKEVQTTFTPDPAGRPRVLLGRAAPSATART